MIEIETTEPDERCTACDRRVYRVPKPQGSRTGLRHWPNGDDGQPSCPANPLPPPAAYLAS